MMKHSQETREQAARLYKDGHSLREIQETLNIKSLQTVYRILEENEITPARKDATKNGARRISIMLSPDAARIMEQAAPKNVSLWVSAQIVAANRDTKIQHIPET